MRSDLQRLRRAIESGPKRVASDKEEETANVSPNLRALGSGAVSTAPRSRLTKVATVIGIFLAAVVGVATWQYAHNETKSLGPSNPTTVAKNTIAVLPLQNMTGDSNIEYLRFALADEIASVLTYNRGLDVRPTPRTRKYVGADVDPQQAGHDMRAANVVTGYYMKQGDYLLVTLQAVNVVNDSVTWQSSQITAPSQNLIALQEALTKQVRSGLLSVLGAGNEYLETSTAPKNQEGYDLFLRSSNN